MSINKLLMLQQIEKDLNKGKNIWVKHVVKDKTSKIFSKTTSYYLLTGYIDNQSSVKFSVKAVLTYNYEEKLIHYSFDTVTYSIIFNYEKSSNLTIVQNKKLHKLKEDIIHLITAKQLLLNSQQHQLCTDMADCNELL